MLNLPMLLLLLLSMYANAAQIVFGSFAAALRPPDEMWIDVWGEQNIVLGPLTPEPGPWRTDRTPYVRDILRCMSPAHPCRSVNWIAGTQLAKTTAEMIIAAYYTHQVPSSVMATLPDKMLAEEWSTKRLPEIFDSSPRLRGRLVSEFDRRSKAGENTKFSKIVRGGGTIKLAWSTSGTLLRSTPARIVINDEVETFVTDVKNQGSALRLIDKRQTNYYGAKTINASSPGIEGASVIWPEFERGDQRYYFVPCPGCDHRQVLLPQNLDWPKGHPELVCFRCVACREAIFERYKTEMLAAGIWVATADHPDLRTMGFPGAELERFDDVLAAMAVEKFCSHHLSAFYSPAGWYSWVEAAQEYEASEGQQADRKTWINTTAAELWRDKGQTPDWAIVEAAALDYPRGRVPASRIVTNPLTFEQEPCGIGLICAGVDVQADRLEYELVGFGPNGWSWSLDYGRLDGDTSLPEVWSRLHAVLMSDIPTEDGGSMPLAAMAIDTGYRPEMVYKFARAHAQIPYSVAQWRVAIPRTVIPVKGDESFDRPIVTVSSEDAAHKRFGVRIYTLGDGYLKTELLQHQLKLSRPDPGTAPPLGYCHTPKGYERTWFRGLCSEEMAVVKGKRVYRELPGTRNEPLDCRVYAMGARILCGAQQWSMETWRAKVAAGSRRDPAIAPSVSRALRPIVPSDPYLMD
jgi:phage terminase large subunit GpA-like protein